MAEYKQTQEQADAIPDRFKITVERLCHTAVLKYGSQNDWKIEELAGLEYMQTVDSIEICKIIDAVNS